MIENYGVYWMDESGVPSYNWDWTLEDFGREIEVEVDELSNFKFRLGDTVRIEEIDCEGRVRSIHIDDEGIKYSIRYFDNAKPQEVLCYEDELTLIHRRVT